MRYLLMICSDEKSDAQMTPEQSAARHEGWGRYTAELHASGKMLGGERLRPASAATTVRQPNGRTLLADGPFAETKEQLGGYYLIDASDLDEAVSWASKMPHLAYGGSVEVRPIWEMG
jgi:hypothetical protein